MTEKAPSHAKRDVQKSSVAGTSSAASVGPRQLFRALDNLTNARKGWAAAPFFVLASGFAWSPKRGFDPPQLHRGSLFCAIPMAVMARNSTNHLTAAQEPVTTGHDRDPCYSCR